MIHPNVQTITRRHRMVVSAAFFARSPAQPGRPKPHPQPHLPCAPRPCPRPTLALAPHLLSAPTQVVSAFAFGEDLTFEKKVGAAIAISAVFVYSIIDDLLKPKATAADKKKK